MVKSIHHTDALPPSENCLTLFKEPRLDQFSFYWERLEKALYNIFFNNKNGLSFASLHRACYTLVVSGFVVQLYNNVSETLAKCVESIAESFLKSASVIPLDYLKSIKHVHLNYLNASKSIGPIFMCLDREFCYPRRQIPVFLLATKHFGDGFLGHDLIRPCLTQTFVELLLSQTFNTSNPENLKEEVDIQAFLSMLYHSDPVFSRTSIKSALETGDYSVHITCNGKFYREVFEIPFLHALTKRYKEESVIALSARSFSHYMARVRETIDFELKRAKLFFRRSTIQHVEQSLIQTWIIFHATILAELCKPFFFQTIDEKRDMDLAYLFSFMSKTPFTSNLIKISLRDSVEDLEFLKSPRNEVSVNYIQTLIQFRARCLYLIDTVFQKQEEFSQTLLQCFENCIRSNSRATLSLVKSFNSFLESDNDNDFMLFTMYSRSTTLTANEKYSTSFIAKVYGHLDLFRYIGNKDIFEQVYRESLARRVCRRLSHSAYQLEKHIIELFSIESGISYTVKLNGILNDFVRSGNIQKQFRKEILQHQQSLQERNLVDCLIFTHTYWPFKAGDVPEVRLPDVLLSSIKMFEEFYVSTYPTQDLTWLACMGYGILSASFEPGPKEIYLNTLQMVILLLFNKKILFTYEEIFKELQPSNITYFQRCLLSLCNTKSYPILHYVLTNQEKKESEIFPYFSDDTVFILNEKFSHPNMRIQLPSFPFQEESFEESKDTSSDPDMPEINDSVIIEERRVIMDSMIVCLMKSHKILTHQSLTYQVTQSLKNRFTLLPDTVEQRIENLIERGFLECISCSPPTYQYIA